MVGVLNTAPSCLHQPMCGVKKRLTSVACPKESASTAASLPPRWQPLNVAHLTPSHIINDNWHLELRSRYMEGVGSCHPPPARPARWRCAGGKISKICTGERRLPWQACYIRLASFASELAAPIRNPVPASSSPGSAPRGLRYLPELLQVLSQTWRRRLAQR
jgi:hypothetical protein